MGRFALASVVLLAGCSKEPPLVLGADEPLTLSCDTVGQRTTCNGFTIEGRRRWLVYVTDSTGDTTTLAGNHLP
jgi:hypothetical protein